MSSDDAGDVGMTWLHLAETVREVQDRLLWILAEATGGGTHRSAATIRRHAEAALHIVGMTSSEVTSEVQRRLPGVKPWG